MELIFYFIYPLLFTLGSKIEKKKKNMTTPGLEPGTSGQEIT